MTNGFTPLFEYVGSRDKHVGSRDKADKREPFRRLPDRVRNQRLARTGRVPVDAPQGRLPVVVDRREALFR